MSTDTIESGTLGNVQKNAAGEKSVLDRKNVAGQKSVPDQQQEVTPKAAQEGVLVSHLQLAAMEQPIQRMRHGKGPVKKKEKDWAFHQIP